MTKHRTAPPGHGNGNISGSITREKHRACGRWLACCARKFLQLGRTLCNLYCMTTTKTTITVTEIETDELYARRIEAAVEVRRAREEENAAMDAWLHTPSAGSWWVSARNKRIEAERRSDGLGIALGERLLAS